LVHLCAGASDRVPLKAGLTGSDLFTDTGTSPDIKEALGITLLNLFTRLSTFTVDCVPLRSGAGGKFGDALFGEFTLALVLVPELTFATSLFERALALAGFRIPLLVLIALLFSIGTGR
jgi:hypothetical protein